MHSRPSRPRFLPIAVVFGFFALTLPGWTLPTVLNYVPTVDTIASRTLLLQISNYRFDFQRFDAVTNPKPVGFKSSSMIYSLEVGFTKAELGVDFIGDKDFSNTRSGNFAGPTAWNFKYRLMTENPDAFSLAVGVFNLGATHYSNTDYYTPSPYFVVGKSFPGFRLHLGYQLNILGYRRLDVTATSSRRNDGIMAGFDAVIIKHPRRPVTLFVDYFGGPASAIGVGLGQNLTPRFGWLLSTYHPTHGQLRDTKWELPKQYWVGLNYLMPF